MVERRELRRSKRLELTEIVEQDSDSFVRIIQGKLSRDNVRLVVYFGRLGDYSTNVTMTTGLINDEWLYGKKADEVLSYSSILKKRNKRARKNPEVHDAASGKTLKDVFEEISKLPEKSPK